MNKNDKYMCSVCVRQDYLNYIDGKSISISFWADSFSIRRIKVHFRTATMWHLYIQCILYTIYKIHFDYVLIQLIMYLFERSDIVHIFVFCTNKCEYAYFKYIISLMYCTKIDSIFDSKCHIPMRNRSLDHTYTHLH